MLITASALCEYNVSNFCYRLRKPSSQFDKLGLPADELFNVYSV